MRDGAKGKRIREQKDLAEKKKKQTLSQGVLSGQKVSVCSVWLVYFPEGPNWAQEEKNLDETKLGWTVSL